MLFGVEMCLNMENTASNTILVFRFPKSDIHYASCSRYKQKAFCLEIKRNEVIGGHYRITMKITDGVT